MLKSIKFKLIGIFIILLVAMVINSIWAIINFRGLHDSIENIMQANYRSVVAAQDMIVAIERQDSAELAYLNEKNEDAKNIYYDNSIVFLKCLSRAEDNITEPGELEIVEKINALYTEYAKKYLSLISIQNNQASDAASKYYYMEILPLFESIKSECRNLLELNQNAMVALQNQSKVMANKATISTTVIAVATALFGLVLAIYMSNKIVNPIQILIQKIKLISEGDYKQKLDISGDDEITELSKEFNVMTQKLNAYEILNIEKLMKEKHKSEAIIESISDGLIVTDEENKVLSINMAAERALGIKEKDVINRHFLEVIKIDEIFEVITRVKNRSVGEEYKRYSNVDITADGITRHFRVNVTPIKTVDEETIGIVTLLQDITKLKEIDQLKSEFVSTVSHEFRTPLTSITMAVGLLLDKVPGEITEDQKELIEAIKEDSLRLTNLVGELLDLSKIESGKMNMDFQSCSIKKIIDDAAKLFLLQLEEKNITFNKNIGEHLSPVKADYNKITWVLTNLIGNAIRYAPSNGKGEIEIKALETANKMLVSVTDNGKGISDENQKTIFDKFVQIKDEKDQSVGGTGLGLAISKEIIKAHGGDIWVSSKLGEGSTFYFTLPFGSKGSES